jgi:Mrp family chromosome partitioning ATPase
MDANRPRGRILTFYSYKGGTGRSMALANIAWLLACNGRRVLVIDWDLEAPGLHRYFHPFLIDKELSASHGLIDMVDNYANQAIRPLEPGATPDPDWYLEYADFSEYIVSVNFDRFGRGGKIDLLPAGRQDDRYAVTVSSFNWQNFFDRLGGGGFFEAVKARARASYDYVLIDSRTGVSDTAGICSVQMPDTLVVCFTYNNQSIKGAAAVARSAVALRAKVCDGRLAARRVRRSRTIEDLEDTPLPYRVFPVPMRVDPGESDRLAIRQAFARESFLGLMDHLAPSDVAEYWTRVEVPHTSFYSYEEVLSTFKDDAHDPKTVLAAFLRLTQYLTDRDVTDFRVPLSPDERRHWLEAFGETPLTAKAKVVHAEQRRETEEAVLARTADAALAALTDEERAVARRVLSRLVRIGREDEGGGCYPIRASISDFSDAERTVIAELTNHRMVKVTTDTRSSSSRYGGPSDRTVSLADDRLLSAWKGLTDWVNADREFLMWRQQMRAYLADWQRSGRDNGALLSGRLLSEADGWTLRRQDDLNAAELEYIESSRRPVVTQAASPAVYPASLGANRSGWWKVAIVLGVTIVIALIFVELSLHWLSGPGAPRTSSGPPAASNVPLQTGAASPSATDGRSPGPARRHPWTPRLLTR